MKYLGSKNRISKHILPIMLEYRNPNMAWLEPFVGGGNIIDKVADGIRIGNDKNEYVISLLIALRDGWIPPKEVSIEYYNEVKQQPNLKGIKFTSVDYKDMEIPPNSLIYCDPPYKGTRPYIGDNKIKHYEFWDWCREKSNEGHIVFVSEYNAPNDFKCIWSKEVIVSGNNKHIERLTNTEKLFII